jgi:hypothetical protein
MKTLFYALAFALLAPLALASITKEGVTMPGTHQVGEVELVLNGVGVRRATFLKVRVYVGGFYLERKSSSPEEFLNFTSPKYISMHFVRNVKASDLTGAWNDGFKAALGEAGAEALSAERQKLNELMTDIKRGEAMNFTFFQDHVIVEMPGKAPARIDGEQFSRGLLSVWFINPMDQDLTNGLLGL